MKRSFMSRLISAYWAARWDWLETSYEGQSLPPAHALGWEPQETAAKNQTDLTGDLPRVESSGPVSHAEMMRTPLPGGH